MPIRILRWFMAPSSFRSCFKTQTRRRLELLRSNCRANCLAMSRLNRVLPFCKFRSQVALCIRLHEPSSAGSAKTRRSRTGSSPPRWPNLVASVSARGYEQVRNKPRVAFEDRGEHDMQPPVIRSRAACSAVRRRSRRPIEADAGKIRIIGLRSRRTTAHRFEIPVTRSRQSPPARKYRVHLGRT